MSDKIARARTQLLLKSPFFGSLVLRLKLQEHGETMATDGYHLFYNKEWTDNLPEKQLQGVIAHEILHCALLHITRKGERDHKKWNAACDYAINQLLLENFDMELPEDRLYDRKYSGMAAEEIYALLPEAQEVCIWGIALTPSGSGEGQGGEEKRTIPCSVEDLENEWKMAAVQAAQAAKACGDNIGGLEALIKAAQAKINWREQLVRLLGAHAKTDFTWMRPDPAYLHKKFIIPTLSEPSLGHLTFAIDTSGSVSNNELSQFIGELQDVLNNVRFEGMTVIECDTHINRVTEYEQDDLIDPKVHGRGGTCVTPVFNYIQDHPTDGLIYFTDMEVCDFPEDPGYPVFWARTGRGAAPFGNYIDLFENS